MRYKTQGRMYLFHLHATWACRGAWRAPRSAMCGMRFAAQVFGSFSTGGGGVGQRQSEGQGIWEHAGARPS
jgi:hypothetical protein